MARHPAIFAVPRMISVVAVLIGLAAGCVSRPAAAEPKAESASEPDAPEAADRSPAVTEDVYPPPSTRTNLVLAGTVTTAVWYGLALGSGLIWPDTVGAKDLRIPVAGPWLALSHSGCGNVSDCSKVIVVLRAIATTLDAIGQASGLAIAGEGLFLPTQEPKRTRAAELKSNSFELHPTFDAGKNSVGFGVLGVF